MKAYYDQDADLKFLDGKTVAVIGYGSQGHAQALNLKESGVRVLVADVPGSENWEKAVADGFEPLKAVEAAELADVIQILIPDEKQAALYRSDIAPHLKSGKALVFSHGFNIHFGQIVPPDDVDVFMVAPKSPGHLVRRMYVEGVGVPSLVAIHQDSTGNALQIALAYAKGIGSTRAGVIETTFEEETETDLFGEQVVMAMNKELITAQALAETLDLSVETIWRYTRENKIPCIELGNRQYRYKLDDVIKALSGDVLREKPVQYETKPTKKLTYQDYLDIPEEPGYRFEILDGILIKEPSPSVMHQRASRKLQRILEDYFEEVDPEGEVFDAPLDVTPLDFNVVQPDLFYVSGEQKLIVKEARIDGQPALVVEIMSPSSARKDRLQKMRIYQKAQVQHYWLLDPQEKTLECFAWRDGVYALVASGMDEDIMEHPNFAGLSIALKSLWSK